jgi:hypothetical protein
MDYPTTQEITDQVNVIIDNIPGLIPSDFADGLKTFFQMMISIVTRLEALEAKQRSKT